MVERRKTLEILWGLGMISQQTRVHIYPDWSRPGARYRDPRLWASVVKCDDGRIQLRSDADGQLYSPTKICSSLQRAGLITWQCRTMEKWFIEAMRISMFHLAGSYRTTGSIGNKN